jgi:hypothetical protein
VQYLVTMDFVDPGPLLPPDQFAMMGRMAVLPGHETLRNLRSEGKIFGRVSCRGKGYSVYHRGGFP